ncbi:MAG: DUF1643 domain-containing protein [Cyanothece sp. SIO2G6]|nr:DUF1643 domain-containing protein [Cyanothece sp. SIO2G6]
MLELDATPSGAIFSSCNCYRYGLWRRWDFEQPLLLFIGLNPSTADAVTNDPTIRRCIGFARSWGYGGMMVTNLFAYRATRPQELRQVTDPIGPETDEWIVRLCQCVVDSTWSITTRSITTSHSDTRVMAIWGNAGAWWGRDRTILNLIRPIIPQLYCLSVTKRGQPAHPLYLPKTLQPKRYSSHHIG